MDNQNPILLNQAGIYYIRNGQYEEALEVLGQGTKLTQAWMMRTSEEWNQKMSQERFTFQCAPPLHLGECLDPSLDIFEHDDVNTMDMCGPQHYRSSLYQQSRESQLLFSTAPMEISLPTNALVTFRSTLMVSCALVFNLGLALHVQATMNTADPIRTNIRFRKALQLYEKSHHLFGSLAQSYEEALDCSQQQHIKQFYVVHLVNMMACYRAIGQEDMANQIFGYLLAARFSEKLTATQQENGSTASRSRDLAQAMERIVAQMVMKPDTTAPAA